MSGGSEQAAARRKFAARRLPIGTRSYARFLSGKAHHDATLVSRLALQKAEAAGQR